MSRKRRTQNKVVDRRVTQTRQRLGEALVNLLGEQPFPSISVQDVLQRAEVGRSTFYAHYRDKDDLFITEMDEHLEYFAMLLTRQNDTSSRVAPVREFFTHLRDARSLYDALGASGRLAYLLELAEAHFARGIQQRLLAFQNPGGGERAGHRIDVVAAALAGALLALLRCWMNGTVQGTPAEIDEIFQALAEGSRSTLTNSDQRGLH